MRRTWIHDRRLELDALAKLGPAAPAAIPVNDTLIGCLKRPRVGAAQLILDLINGQYGDDIGGLAWWTLRGDLVLRNAPSGPWGRSLLQMPAAEIALRAQTLTTIRTVLDAGPSRFACEEHLALSRSQYLDLLSSGGKFAEQSFVAIAASSAPDLITMGLDFAWEIQHGHGAWERLGAEPTAAGAAVRAYLMTRQMNACATPPLALTRPSAIPRRPHL